MAAEKIGITHFCVCVRALAGESARARVDTRAQKCAYARGALLIQHAMRRHNVICGLSGSTTFFNIIS